MVIVHCCIIYIVIKVEYGLQLHFKIFLNKSDRKINKKIIIKMLTILDFKIYFHFDILSSIDDIHENN